MSPFLIDTHAHLDFHQFDGDRKDVILRANESNVHGIITIGTDLATSTKSVAIAAQYAHVFAAVGLHPHDVSACEAEHLPQLYELLQDPQVIAIGEVGLDFYRNLSPQDEQRRMFRMFLDWADETGKPLIIHTREADEAIISLLKERSKSGWRGVFHCFSGDAAMAQQVLQMGFYISFTGNITFKNSRAVGVLQEIPLERLLVETDSPFMAPVPHRGKRNEPAYVQLVAQKMAQVKGISLEKLAQVTTANAMDLFALPLTAAETPV